MLCPLVVCPRGHLRRAWDAKRDYDAMYVRVFGLFDCGSVSWPTARRLATCAARAARALAPLAPLALSLVLSPLAWLCGCGVGARLFALLRHVAAVLFRSCRVPWRRLVVK